MRAIVSILIGWSVIVALLSIISFGAQYILWILIAAIIMMLTWAAYFIGDAVIVAIKLHRMK